VDDAAKGNGKSMEHVKICPKCGAEYYPDILDCADCHVALQWSQALPQLSPAQAEELGRLEENKWWGVDDTPRDVNRSDGWDRFDPDEVLGHLSSDLERIVAIYRTGLARAGIPTAILPTTRYQPAIDRVDQSPVMGNRHVVKKAGQVPVGDVLGGFQYDLFARRADFERAEEIISEMFGDLHPDQEKGFYAEYELGHCPACGSELAEHADECPDCGLPFSAQEE